MATMLRDNREIGQLVKMSGSLFVILLLRNRMQIKESGLYSDSHLTMNSFVSVLFNQFQKRLVYLNLLLPLTQNRNMIKLVAMKKTLTPLIFVFLTNGLLFGQTSDLCPARANGASNFRTFNLNYDTDALAAAAFAVISSITVPALAGGTITVPKSGLEYIGQAGTRYRIRPFFDLTGPYGGQSQFTGDVVINLTDGSGLTCTYEDNALMSSTLPVDLISFNGIRKDRQINLSWKTISEYNNEGFVIERGHKIAYGMEWIRLGFIESKGTTQELQTYSFIDQNPKEGINYYRLKQLDYDGKHEYSFIVAVEYSSKNRSTSIGIFPNPAKDLLMLKNGEGKVTIFNILGQPVKYLTIDANETTIQLTDLLNGQYYLQVLQEDGKVVTKQFAKVY